MGGTSTFPSPFPLSTFNTITSDITAVPKHNYFQFQNKYHKQSNGSPMRSVISNTVSKIPAVQNHRKIRKHLMCRYSDNLFFIYSNIKCNAEFIQGKFNKMYNGITLSPMYMSA
jgi:hypothetical protein